MWHVQRFQSLVLLAAACVLLCSELSCGAAIPLGYGPPASPADLLNGEAAQPPQSASAGQADLEYIQLETIQPYLNSTYPPLPETFLVVNFTYRLPLSSHSSTHGRAVSICCTLCRRVSCALCRFIGNNLTYPNATFKTILTDAFVALAVSKASLQIGVTYRPGVGAPISGPDGKSGLAYAPTSGMGEQHSEAWTILNSASTAHITSPGQHCCPAVPEDFGRKLLQGGTQVFNKYSFDNRDIIYESIDVEFMATGTGASSAINVFRPTVLNGYITTLFAQQGINVSRATAS